MSLSRKHGGGGLESLPIVEHNQPNYVSINEKITMLLDRHGSPDGITTYLYRSGEEYPAEGFPMSMDLATVFLENEWAAWSVELGPGGRTDSPTETTSICGQVYARGPRSGELCQERKPCRYHDRTR